MTYDPDLAPAAPAPFAGAPAGWYPDPTGPTGRRRRWDGTAWTDTWMRAPRGGASAAARDRLGTGFARTALATRGALWLVAVVLVVDATVSWWARGRMASWRVETLVRPDDGALFVDRVTMLSGFLVSAATLLAGGLFLGWFVAAYRSDRVDPSCLEHGWGWALGAWFVPVLNLVRPFRMTHDLVLGAQSRAGREDPATRSCVTAWWAVVLGGVGLAVVVGLAVPAFVADPVQQVRTTLALAPLTAAVSALGCALAERVVRGVTRLLLG